MPAAIATLDNATAKDDHLNPYLSMTSDIVLPAFLNRVCASSCLKSRASYSAIFLIMSPRRTSPPSCACSSNRKITMNHTACCRYFKQGSIVNTILPKFMKLKLIFLGTHKIKSTVVKCVKILPIKKLKLNGKNHSKVLRSDGKSYLQDTRYPINRYRHALYVTSSITNLYRCSSEEFMSSC